MHTVGQTAPIIGGMWDMLIVMGIMIFLAIMFHVDYKYREKNKLKKLKLK